MMKSLRRPILRASICSLVFITGCAATRQFVPRPLDNAVASGQTAIVHVKRVNIGLGEGRAVTVQDDGRAVGEIGPDGELIWERPAGQMTLSLAPAWGAVSDDTPPLVATVEPRKAYTYWVRLKGGYFVLSEKDRGGF